jgi:hypothetical protein
MARMTGPGAQAALAPYAVKVWAAALDGALAAHAAAVAQRASPVVIARHGAAAQYARRMLRASRRHAARLGVDPNGGTTGK